uniref:Uncharacterized protein n=1 Tax=Megaselia scalaris TaxID=36166 RepID=T1GJV3_MEGSC
MSESWNHPATSSSLPHYTNFTHYPHHSSPLPNSGSPPTHVIQSTQNHMMESYGGYLVSSSSPLPYSIENGRGLQFSGLSLSALPSMNSTTTSTNGNYHHDSRKISSTAGYGPPLTPPGSLSTPPLNPSSAATVATSATPASLTPPYYEHQHIKYSPN